MVHLSSAWNCADNCSYHPSIPGGYNSTRCCLLLYPGKLSHLYVLVACFVSARPEIVS